MDFYDIRDDENNENTVDDPPLGEAAEGDDNLNLDFSASQQSVTTQGDALLIQLVSNYPVLYDKTHPQYKNIQIRENCWTSIGVVMEQTAKCCMKRWAQLRESFGRENKKRENESRSGSGATNRKGFTFFEDMRFLQKHISQRRTLTNVNPVSPMSSWTPLDIPRLSTFATFTGSSGLHTPPPTPTPPLDVQISSTRPETLTPTRLTISPPAAMSVIHQRIVAPISSPDTLVLRSLDTHVLSSPGSSLSTSYSDVSQISPSPTSEQPLPRTFSSGKENVSEISSSASYESYSNPQRGTDSRTTRTSSRPLVNDVNKRWVPCPQSSSSFMNDNIREISPPSHKLAKPSACYNKELSKSKKNDPVDASFVSLSSAFQEHLNNRAREGTYNKSSHSTDADELFGSLIASELKKLNEPLKTAKKSRVLQVLYEKEERSLTD